MKKVLSLLIVAMLVLSLVGLRRATFAQEDGGEEESPEEENPQDEKFPKEEGNPAFENEEQSPPGGGIYPTQETGLTISDESKAVLISVFIVVFVAVSIALIRNRLKKRRPMF